MKLPIPEEVTAALSETAANMKGFGDKLDKVIELLEKIEQNTRQ